MRKLIFLLLIFCILCPSVSAFEDATERHTSSYQELWYEDIGTTSGYSSSTTISRVSDPVGYTGNTVLRCTSTVYADTGFLASKDPVYLGYISWIYKGSTIPSSSDLKVLLLNYSTNATLCTAYTMTNSNKPPTNAKIELILSGGNILTYQNGTLVSSVDKGVITADTPLRISFGAGGGGTAAKILYIDDITTNSIIGVPETFTESEDTIYFTWSSQLLRSYSAQHKISLYSLTNPSNAGIITSWNIPENDSEYTAREHGFITANRSILGTNFGLYLLEITRANEVTYDQYFYYDQLSSPQGYPEILFLGESEVNTEIRDEDNNGGEIEGGGSVYLYPDIQEDGTYNFTYEILETPYAIKTELTAVYNNTAINGTTINYTGLSNQNYKISVDGAEVGSTSGADTYSYTFTDWGTETNHIISFAPDYTVAGVWGEVKNSETQEGIKSATVSISGDNFSKTLYTDDNGLFYLTKGLEAGKTYTISVSKTGYSTPPSQTAITVEGSTTRQDFYMDKLSTTGSGLYYAPHDVGFTVLEYWYSGAGLTGVTYSIYNGTESIKTGTTDSKGMFTGSDMTGGTNYTITLTHNGTTYTEYVEPSLTEYTFVLNKEGILHQYVNSWLTLSYTENTQNVTIAYNSNKTITGASLTAIAGNGTTVYSQTLNTTTGTFTFETGGEGDYTLNFHIQAADGSTASQSWGLSYPDKIPLFPDSYPAWLKNVLFSGIIMVFLLAFGKAKNDIACGAVAILTSMGYLFEWFTGSFYFVVLVWIIALGAVFLHYKRTGGIG